MESMDFSLRLITHAFVAGAVEQDIHISKENNPEYLKADGKDRTIPHRIIRQEGDGLRVPSLRGILRFWYRALVGDSIPSKSLFGREGDWMGSTESGQGLRIIPCGQSAWQPSVVELSPAKNSGLAYLGFGPLGFVKGLKPFPVSSHNKEIWRDAIQTGAQFHFRAVGNKTQLETLLDVLLIIHLFGGIGARSRRGWGSLAVDLDGKPLFNPASGSSVSQELAACLVPLSRKYHWLEHTSLPAFTAFSRHTEIRYKLTEDGYFFKDPKLAHEELGTRLRQSRFYDTRNPANSSPVGLQDHKNERDDFDREEFTHLPQRMTFGAPYQIRFNTVPKGEMQYVRMVKDKPELFRRASPLLLKVMEWAPDAHIGIVLYLKSSYFPKSGYVHLQIKKQDNRQMAHKGKFRLAEGSQPQPEDDAAIRDFLNIFPAIRIF